MRFHYRVVRSLVLCGAFAAPLAAQQYTIDFESLPPGTIASTVDAVGGGGSLGPIFVEGSRLSLPGTNVALVFDSSAPTGGDFDLGTPNVTFGGPGIGEAGESGEPNENDTPLGHILIVAENLVDAGGDGLVDGPDDADEIGMKLELDFGALAAPGFSGVAEVLSFTAIDIQQSEGELPSTAVFFGAGGGVLGTVQIGDLGNNGVKTFVVGVAGVERIEFRLNGSGGIDNVVLSGELTDLGCRVTGGGVDGDNHWDGTLVEGECTEENRTNRYTFGGQAGAPTGAQPQPWGEWTHAQHRGPAGKFTFHAGTASAPDETEISLIECGDPGFCDPARPAPTKQIRFEGVGSFKNIGNGTTVGSAVAGETLHYFFVRINDAGEGGATGGPPHQQDIPEECPGDGFDVFSDPASLVQCECPDFYRISIYDTANPPAPGEEPIYSVCGYIFGGNLQIHPSLDD